MLSARVGVQGAGEGKEEHRWWEIIRKVKGKVLSACVGFREDWFSKGEQNRRAMGRLMMGGNLEEEFWCCCWGGEQGRVKEVMFSLSYPHPIIVFPQGEVLVHVVNTCWWSGHQLGHGRHRHPLRLRLEPSDGLAGVWERESVGYMFLSLFLSLHLYFPLFVFIALFLQLLFLDPFLFLSFPSLPFLTLLLPSPAIQSIPCPPVPSFPFPLPPLLPFTFSCPHLPS